MDCPFAASEADDLRVVQRFKGAKEVWDGPLIASGSGGPPSTHMIFQIEEF